MKGCPSIDVARRAIKRPSLEIDPLFGRDGGVGQRPDFSKAYISCCNMLLCRNKSLPREMSGRLPTRFEEKFVKSGT